MCSTSQAEDVSVVCQATWRQNLGSLATVFPPTKAASSRMLLTLHPPRWANPSMRAKSLNKSGNIIVRKAVQVGVGVRVGPARGVIWRDQSSQFLPHPRSYEVGATLRVGADGGKCA
jgi:hypothetical protein